MGLAKRLTEIFRRIGEIKAATYPAVVGRDGSYDMVERPWIDLGESAKLAILQDAVNWSGISNRDMAHILLAEIDPGKITDMQRNRLIDMATSQKAEQKDTPDNAMEGREHER